MKKKNKAAFFDFDQTLLADNSTKLGMKYLWDRRELPFLFLLRVMSANVLYKRHVISEERMARIVMTFYKNRQKSDLENGAEIFYRDYLKPQLAPNIVKRMEIHREEGYSLVLVSGSIRYYLQSLVTDLGFDHLICTDLEEGPDGLLTGNPAGVICVDKNKKTLIQNLAEKEDIDLSLSCAYGNHQSDIPMLSMVGQAFVVEPTEPAEAPAEDVPQE